MEPVGAESASEPVSRGDNMSERGIRVPITSEGIELVRKYKSKGRDELDDLAVLAGTLYVFGGMGGFIIARGFLPNNGDIPQSNQFFIGHRAKTKDDVYRGKLKVLASRRRLGYIYWAVSVSEVIKGSGGPKSKGDIATAMIVGYVLDTEGGKSGKNLEVEFLATTAPPPIRWYGISDFDKGAVDWPNEVRKENRRHREASDAIAKSRGAAAS